MDSEEKPGEPVVAVFADGKVQLGTGVTLGAVLAAIETARQAVLGITLTPPAKS